MQPLHVAIYAPPAHREGETAPWAARFGTRTSLELTLRTARSLPSVQSVSAFGDPSAAAVAQRLAMNWLANASIDALASPAPRIHGLPSPLIVLNAAYPLLSTSAIDDLLATASATGAAALLGAQRFHPLGAFQPLDGRCDGRWLDEIDSEPLERANFGVLDELPFPLIALAATSDAPGRCNWRVSRDQSALSTASELDAATIARLIGEVQP